MSKKVKKGLRVIKVSSYIILLLASILKAEQYLLVIIALCSLAVISFIEIKEWGDRL